MDGTSAAGVPQEQQLHGTMPEHVTPEQWAEFTGAAGERSRGDARREGPGDGSDAADVEPIGLFGSLEENHKCCAPGENQGEKPSEVSRASYQVVSRGCKNRHCPDCCEHMGVKLRERVRGIVGNWKACLLVTLTVDPESVGSPLEAMQRVRDRRALSRLVRSLLKSGHLKSGRYFAAIEFQKNGNPHWHLLLETSFVPIERVQELWDKNRPETAGPVQPGRPGFGFVWMSKDNFQSVAHAANYVTKYVLKYPKEGYPDWVLDFEGRVPKYSTSRDFWGDDDDEEQIAIEPVWCFCMKCRGEKPAGTWKPIDLPPEAWAGMGGEQHKVGILPNGLERREVLFPNLEEPGRRRVERQTIRKRVAACGEVGAVVLQRSTEKRPHLGEPVVQTKWYWLGMLSMPFVEFAETQPERRKRYEVTEVRALELVGALKPWQEGFLQRVREAGSKNGGTRDGSQELRT